jgi:hypothetical protein
MSIMVKKAETREEINDVLSLRYAALVSTGRSPHEVYRQAGKISDSYDVYHTTRLIVAYERGTACATARLVDFSVETKKLETQFDFSTAINTVEGKNFYLDMVCFHGNHWPTENLFQELLSFSLLSLHEEKISGLFFLVPEIFKSASEEMGFKTVGDTFYSNEKQVNLSPGFFDVEKFYANWSSKVSDQEILRFQNSFYKALFYPGDILILQGERGGSAYLIEQGELDVLIEAGDIVKSVGTIKAGSLVGEMAMVTGEKRTASVMARIPTVCLAFDRGPFMKILETSPQRVIDIFRLFSKRIASANQRLATKSE